MFDDFFPVEFLQLLFELLVASGVLFNEFVINVVAGIGGFVGMDGFEQAMKQRHVAFGLYLEVMVGKGSALA